MFYRLMEEETAAHAAPVKDSRRAELADFLRRKRAQLTTDMAGLPATHRRRTPGLRREEVAELADISTALYAWLEQGRDVPVSRRTIDAIANALRCAPDERNHLYALATHERSDLREQVSATLERMIGSLRTNPVFVLDHKWDIVMYNRAAQVVFDHDGHEHPAQMNLLEATFSPERRRLFVNWREVAGSLVELFRFDYARYASDPGTLALVDKLRRSDPLFASIWEGHGVRSSPSATRELNHPVAGFLALEPSIYAVVESPGLRCMIYTPGDDGTAGRINAMVAAAAARKANPTITAGLPST